MMDMDEEMTEEEIREAMLEDKMEYDILFAMAQEVVRDEWPPNNDARFRRAGHAKGELDQSEQCVVAPLVWPPKQDKHPKGARLPKGQRTHEAVEALWLQVRDTTLPDWARRSSLLYLVRSARSHVELFLAANGFRSQPWARHYNKTGAFAGDFLASLDNLAAIRAVDLGWTIEWWIDRWFKLSAGFVLSDQFGSAELLAGLRAKSPDVPLPPSTFHSRRMKYELPWVTHLAGGVPVRGEFPPPPTVTEVPDAVAPPARPQLRVVPGGR